MRKGLAAVIATAAMLGTVVCGSMVANAAEDMTFVIVPKCVHAWFDEVNKGAVAEAEVLSEQLGVEVKIDYRAPQTADVVEQNTTLEQAAATHPDGIALDPVDYEGSKAVIEEIQAQGIPVILFDAPSPEGSGLTSVGNDFAEQASLAAEKLVEILGEEGGKVAVMQGAPSAPNHAERYEAHLAVLAKYPQIEVIEGGIDNDNIETAQQQAAAVMAANPDLKGFLNCDACGSGVAAAIEEAGKAGEVKFVSMDNLIEILNYVKTGTITATSSTIPQMQGSMSVLMMWQASLGIEIPAKVDTGIAYIDETNIDEWIAMVSE
ncbi:MAG: substrate-binding domain-containing protein [Lachnospiraceae bacterium]|nr:substrate-binding domain-containing protein [Lachnospiraceae bacterium]